MLQLIELWAIYIQVRSLALGQWFSTPHVFSVIRVGGLPETAGVVLLLFDHEQMALRTFTRRLRSSLEKLRAPARIRSDVVIQEKLVRMWSDSHRVRFLSFCRHPHFQKVAAENIAF